MSGSIWNQESAAAPATPMTRAISAASKWCGASSRSAAGCGAAGDSMAMGASASDMRGLLQAAYMLLRPSRERQTFCAGGHVFAASGQNSHVCGQPRDLFPLLDRDV